MSAPGHRHEWEPNFDASATWFECRRCGAVRDLREHAVCLCGASDKDAGPRLDILCPVHDPKSGVISREHIARLSGLGDDIECQCGEQGVETFEQHLIWADRAWLATAVRDLRVSCHDTEGLGHDFGVECPTVDRADVLALLEGPS